MTTQDKVTAFVDRIMNATVTGADSFPEVPEERIDILDAALSELLDLDDADVAIQFLVEVVKKRRTTLPIRQSQKFPVWFGRYGADVRDWISKHHALPKDEHSGRGCQGQDSANSLS